MFENQQIIVHLVVWFCFAECNAKVYRDLGSASLLAGSVGSEHVSVSGRSCRNIAWIVLRLPSQSSKMKSARGEERGRGWEVVRPPARWRPIEGCFV